jgi:adhesin/invasin
VEQGVTLGRVKYSISAPPTVTAGQPFDLTVTALNALGSPLTGYSGTIDFSAADQAEGFPATAQFTFEDHGVLSVPVTLTTAGTVTVNLADSVVASATGTTSFTVGPGPVSAGVSTVSFNSPSDASGTQDQATIVLKDAYGNPIPGLANSAFNFSLAGGTSTGTFGTVTPAGTPGTYTAEFTGVRAGSASSLTLTVNGVELLAVPTITVTPGAVDPNRTTFDTTASSDVSGTPDPGTIVVEDAAGNALSGLTNTDFSFSQSPGSSTGSFGPVSATSTPGTYTTNFTGALAGSADTLTLDVDGVQIASQPEVTVTPGSPDPVTSSFSLQSPSDVSGLPDLATITLVDAAGNSVTGLTGSAFTFDLTHGTSTGAFEDWTETSTPGTYTANFIGAVAGTPSLVKLLVDNIRLAAQPSVTVCPGAVDPNRTTSYFATPTDASGTSDNLTVVVKDASGNAVTGLNGTAFSPGLTGGSSTGSFGTTSASSTPGTYTIPLVGITAGTPSSLSLIVNGVTITSEPTVQVTPGSISSTTTLAAFTNSSDASGTPDTLTIAVKDNAGNAIEGVPGGSFNVGLSGGTSTGTFGAVTPTSTPGTYTVPFTGVLAGTPGSLTLSINGLAIDSAPTVQVTAGAVSGETTTASFATQVDASGIPDLISIVVEDAAGNPVSGLSGTVFNLSLTGGTSTGSFGTPSGTSTPGLYTVPFTGTLAGTQSNLDLQVGGVTISSTPSVRVTAGAASGVTSSITLANSTDASGATDSATVVVKDAAGNAATGLSSGDFSCGLTGGSSTGTFGTVNEISPAGTYTVQFTGDTAGTASTLALRIDGALLANQPSVTVIPGTVDPNNSTFALTSPTDASGTTDAITIVVEDAAGNAITGLASSAFDFTLAPGTSTGSFGSVSAIGTPGTYTGAFTGVIAGSTAGLGLKISGIVLNDPASVMVTPGAVSAGQTTASFSSPTMTAGTSDTLTIVAEDAAGNLIPNLPGTGFDPSLSGGGSGNTFGATSQTGTPGIYTTVFTGTRAGSPGSLDLTIDGVQISADPTLQVVPSALSLANSSLSLASPTDPSGTLDSATIVLEDAYGNGIGGLQNSAFTFSTAGGTSTGSFGTVTGTSTPGTYTADFAGDLAGTASTITLNVGGVALATQPQVTVIPGAPSASATTLGFATHTLVAGSTDTLTIVVKDAAGNPVTGLANTDFALRLAGGQSNGSLGSVTPTSTPGTYACVFTGVNAGTASSLTATVNGVQISAESTVQVTVGPLNVNTSMVSVASPTVASGTTDTITIMLEDAEGNAITGLASSALKLSLSGGTSSGTLGPVAQTSTPGTYTAGFKGALAGTPKTLSLTVNGTAIASHPTVQVVPGAVSASNSTVSVASAADASGQADLVTVKVRDAAGNPVIGLSSGNFAFSLSGGTSTASFGPVAATAQAGVYSVPMTGYKAGSATPLQVTINGALIADHPRVTVTSGTVSATNSSASFVSSTLVSGSNETLVLVAKDAAGNAITGLTKSNLTLGLFGGQSSGTFGSLVPTATPGHYTVRFTGTVAGTTSTLAATINGVQLASQPAVTVVPGAPNRTQTEASFANSDVAAGDTDVLTIQVKDAAGNAIPDLLNGNFVFGLSGSSTGAFGTVTETSTPGTYTVTFTAGTAGTASQLSISVAGILIGEKPKVTVTV